MKSLIAVSLFAFLVAACATTQQMHPVQARAPFDLGCPADQVLYFPIDDNTIGAEGCGHRLTYVQLCRQVRSGFAITSGSHDECQWVSD